MIRNIMNMNDCTKEEAIQLFKNAVAEAREMYDDIFSRVEYVREQLYLDADYEITIAQYVA